MIHLLGSKRVDETESNPKELHIAEVLNRGHIRRYYSLFAFHKALALIRIELCIDRPATDFRRACADRRLMSK